MEEFHFDHQSPLKRHAVTHLGTLDFLAAKENAVVLGPLGTGNSNKPFGGWGEVFGDDVVAAIIDHLVRHAEIISIKEDSYRVKDHDFGHVPPAIKTQRLTTDRARNSWVTVRAELPRTTVNNKCCSNKPAHRMSKQSA